MFSACHGWGFRPQACLKSALAVKRALPDVASLLGIAQWFAWGTIGLLPGLADVL